MMHQAPRVRNDTYSPVLGADPDPLTVLAYRSRATAPPTDADLDELLRTAQARNHAHGVTGILVYDDGHFMQWLEGPRAAVGRIWDSIRRDPRHDDFTILRQQAVPKRFFTGWDMRLVRRMRGPIDKVLAVMQAPQDLPDRFRVPPAALPADAWERLFAEVVIPSLRSTVARFGRRPIETPAAALWHAQREAGPALANILLAVDAGGTARYVDSLVEQGAGLEALYQGVFEPAARCLGGLWEDDHCNDLEVTLALGRLQVEARRMGAALAHPEYLARPGHAVLVAPQPGEPHGLNATLCSELFHRQGWDVSSEFPSSDGVLREILHAQWFDVLELSSSGAVRREQQLPAMRLTIRAARAASLNPALAVIVDGRSFFDRPRAYLDVGADLGCLTSTDAVPAAEQLLASSHSRVQNIFTARSSRPRQG
jgi:hypothetical protein